MPKATSKSVHVSHTSANKGLEDFNNSQEPPSENKFQEDSIIAHESNSEDEVELQFQPSISQAQVIQQVYMPYT